MTYKTILVHCNDQRRIDQLLAPALQLAGQFQSHVVGLSVVPPVSVIAADAVAAAPVVVDVQCQIYREENPAMRKAFEDAARARSLSSEWRDAEAGPYGVAEVVLEHGRAADLIVASQSKPDWPASGWLDVADRLAMESGRPVLILPNSPRKSSIGKRVLVAWNGRREAARAVFDALPILKQSDAVKVAWINPQSPDQPTLLPPAQDVCSALVRHGVKCTRTEPCAPLDGVGATLAALAKDFDADLLVMGCYGHSRLREFVFGGASRHMLSHMAIPVLMSH